MTRPDMDAIRARCDAATPGPWTYDEIGYVDVGLPRSRSIAVGIEIDATAKSDGDFIAHARTDIPALLTYIEELERAVENERLTFKSCNRARIHCENECDSLHARVNELHDEIDKAQAAFDHGCGQDGPDGWEPGETAVDALVRAKHERDQERTVFEQAMAEAQTDVMELRARITTLEAMKT